MTSDRGLWDSSSSGSWHHVDFWALPERKPSSHGSKRERARSSQESHFLIRRKIDQGNAGRVEVSRSCRSACCRAVPSSRESAPTLKHTQQQKLRSVSPAPAQAERKWNCHFAQQNKNIWLSPMRSPWCASSWLSASKSADASVDIESP